MSQDAHHRSIPARTAGGRTPAGGVRPTREWIARRLRHGAVPGPAPRGRGDHDLNPGMRPPALPSRAAMLVPLVERGEGMTVLLTLRTDHLDYHAGQISFPGGRVEDRDAGPEHTALRETEEELGLPRRHVDLAGRLDVYRTRTGFEVIPVVGFLRPPFPLVPDPSEVAEVFEVPLGFILDRANHERHERDGRVFYAMPYDRHFIWGATAGMLVNLCDVLDAG